jgi:streptogramin lyase
MLNKPRLPGQSDTDVRTQEQERTSLTPTEGIMEPEEDATRPHPIRWLLFGALILVVVIGAGTFILLPHNTPTPTTGTSGTTSGNTTSPSSALAHLPTLTTGATSTLQVKTYQVSQADAGLMPPVADQHGNLWFGEMSQNQLTQLDTTTGKLTNRSLPTGLSGIMNTAVDAQGNVWFANQITNNIGRFTPQTQQFKQFPLPMTGGKSLGIQDLHFDNSGQLWFTALSSGQLGRLNPQTGATHLWSFPAGLYPSSITTSANGLIWVGMLSGGTIGRFNPATSQFTLLHLSDPQSSVSALANDNHGHIWFTEMHAGVLGEVDINSNPLQLREQRIVLPNSNTTVTLAGLAVTADGTVWLSNPDNGILLRYQPGETHFTTIHLAQTTSKPYLLASDTHGNLWFTASDTTSIIGQITTPKS